MYKEDEFKKTLKLIYLDLDDEMQDIYCYEPQKSATKLYNKVKELFSYFDKQQMMIKETKELLISFILIYVTILLEKYKKDDRSYISSFLDYFNEYCDIYLRDEVI